jgi:hypothetical protein
MSIDFTATVVGGVLGPRFRYWYDGIPQDSVDITTPQGTSSLIFTPHSIIYDDINWNEREIHRGFKVEFKMNFEYLTAAQMKAIIKVFSWRSYEPNRIRIQCHPHIDLPSFSFDGRFDGDLPFSYPLEKYIGHKCQISFKSTKSISDIPRHTANVIINRRVY